MISTFVPAFLASIGLDFGRLVSLARATVTKDAEGRSWVSTRDYFALWDAASGLGLPPDFGLRLGSMQRIEGHYDVASIAALHSETFRDAINALARYKQMVCPGRWVLDVENGVASLEFKWLLAGDHLAPDFLTDGGFAYVAELYRRGTGRALKLRRIELTRRPNREDLLSDAFECAIRFNAPRDVMVFDAASLEDPFLTHNQELVRLMIPGLEAAFGRFRAGGSTVTDVQLAIHGQLKGARPSVERVASAMGIGPRTLQRRLEEAGTTYQEQLDKVRHVMARQMLEQTDLEQGEIAFYLGFEESNSFARAFRAWQGMSPTQWRQAVRSGPPSRAVTEGLLSSEGVA
ncbi:AraC family transcriptional regulator [Roseateles depolymerans]|uniref:Transcriptional regulatory protein n=2 Tax=Roseateles depolymerans TaxID=76731 RepID=A0A0U3MC16_9BURK|nr:Transcriptional regulatory protein [Roseateles depolymerans]REG12830.1 AraC family transcriptional regulator [Roseateles depolymerans]